MHPDALPAPFADAQLPVEPGKPLPPLAIGGSGAMRAQGQPIIEAENDLEAVCQWLVLKVLPKSPHTLSSYWSQVERLLHWAAIERGKSLSQLLPADYLAYVEFMKDPTGSVLCGPRVPRGHPEWCPFIGPLKASSRETALRTLGSLLGFLNDTGYFKANPLKVIAVENPQKTAPAKKVERFLNAPLWQHTLRFVERWPVETPQQVALFERARWVLSLLYGLDMRRAEVVSHTQGIFHPVHRPSGVQWWASFTGKGNKERTIPVPGAVMAALARYRAHLGLPPEPTHEDPTPLVCRLGALAPISGNMLYTLLKEIFAGAAAALKEHDPAGAEHLSAASTHWLRHTGITAKGDAGVSLRHRGQSAGHSRLETTSRYDHATADDWYEDLQKVALEWQR